MKKIRITAIVGPTASGKSSLALSLARALDGEIVSADSMQIYRGMDIGTAKPSAAELGEIPHHMIDIADPAREYTLADYVRDAAAAIEDIAARGKEIIICGGTGLYLDTLLRGGVLPPDVPESAYDGLDGLDNEALHAELARIDPASAAAIHCNNRRRVERALAIFRGTGRTKSEWDELSRQVPPPYDALIVGLYYADRSLLYSRIDRRVDEMVAAGLAEEVRSLGLSRDTTAGQAIGYKEIMSALDGKCSMDDAVSQIKQATRNYAKRQMTWFGRNENIVWYYPDKDCDIVNNVLKLLTNRD